MDNDLVRRAQQGDVMAFEAIYRQHGAMVYRIALRMTARHEDAEEVTQQVFLSVHRHLASFAGNASLKTWIYRIAVNCSLNALKKGKRHLEVAWEEGFDPEDPGHDARDDADKKLQSQQITALLDQIDPDQKACLVLRAQEGLSYQQISTVLNVGLNTVRSRIKRGRERLVEMYQKEKGGL